MDSTELVITFGFQRKMVALFVKWEGHAKHRENMSKGIEGECKCTQDFLQVLGSVDWQERK